MWADTDTDIDFLNYSEVAELIAEMIGKPHLLPMSLGVFGSWGVGKSSTLRLVAKDLDKNKGKYLLINFDAWLYQDFDDARAALMSVIASELLQAAPQSLTAKAMSLFGRINKLRALGLLAEGGALAMGVPTFGLITRGLEGARDILEGKGDPDDLEAIRKAGADAKEQTSGLLKNVSEKGPPEEIAAFRKEFGEVLEGLGKTLVVFIDNLDRCLPENAIHTLEAVRLFLFMPKTAFVIGADEDMIRHAVARHFKEPGEKQVTDYLDKLIQIPVRVPRLGVEEVRAYLFLLLFQSANSDPAAQEKLRSFLIERLRRSWTHDQPFAIDDALESVSKKDDADLRRALDMADRMSPLLAHAAHVQGNPRIVKRLLNVVRMRASIAAKRKMPLDEAIIAKLALFERCVDTSATEALHDAINAAADGKLKFLQGIESGEPIDEHKSELPDKWQSFLPFIADWARLEPKLADLDLKPAAYLARETIPVRVASGAVSPAVTKAAEELVRTPSMSSRAAADAVTALKGGHETAAMEAIVTHMRKDPDWTRVRADARGAILLARASAEAAKVATRFFRDLPSVPPWLRSMLKDEAWYEA
ncbi:KAP family P-loop NTPase fold protein [Bradyrhizobium sp. HKCCYLS20291]|uniref:KAP family P-loop NTPase fold protein n=1 Tax=Bradyrhizobium sp. HKCCYLS20291 TaxID=3420766 RepID=UPI003EB76492